MDFIFYKSTGILHDVCESFEDDTINPATRKVYGEHESDNLNAYMVKSIENILSDEDKSYLRHLAEDYPEDLIEAIKCMDY